MTLYSIVLICRFSLLSPYQWKFGSSFSTYLPSSSRSLSSSSSRFSWYIIWHWHCCDTLRWCLWEFYSRLEIYYSAHLFFNLKQSDRLKLLLCYDTLWAKYSKIVCDDKSKFNSKTDMKFWHLMCVHFPPKLEFSIFFGLMVFAIKMLLDKTYGLTNFFNWWCMSEWASPSTSKIFIVPKV